MSTKKNLMWEQLPCGLLNPGRKGLLSAPSGHPQGCWRARVPGGWLIAIGSRPDALGDLALTFMPDPAHSWTGASLD